jgi:hypothetical protein
MRICQNHDPQLILLPPPPLPRLWVGTAVQGDVVHQKLAEHQRRYQAHRRNPAHSTRPSHPDHGLYKSCLENYKYILAYFSLSRCHWFIFHGLDVPWGVASQLISDLNAVDLQLKRDLLEKRDGASKLGQI